MKILAEESVDAPIVGRLRIEGHEVSSVAESSPGKSDAAVLNEAEQTGRILLTSDKDFGELAIRWRKIQTGVILLRLEGLSPESKAELVAEVLEHHAAEVRASFIVISPGSVRIRPLSK